jgi:hypothetical protein
MTMKSVTVRLSNIVRLSNDWNVLLDALEVMRDWCKANADTFLCDIPLDCITPRTNKLTNEFVEALIACKSKPTFTFGNDTDAVAFKLTFADYL